MPHPLQGEHADSGPVSYPRAARWEPVTVLAELAAGQRPLSHAALDDLPPGKPIEHLRAVLVATAALPARDEQLARIERWVTEAVSEHAEICRVAQVEPHVSKFVQRAAQKRQSGGIALFDEQQASETEAQSVPHGQRMVCQKIQQH